MYDQSIVLQKKVKKVCITKVNKDVLYYKSKQMHVLQK